MEDVFLKNIKTVYTQHEYCWTAKSSNANTLFLFLLFSLLSYANKVRVYGSSSKTSKSSNAVDQIESTVLRQRSWREEALGINRIVTSKTILSYSCQIIHLTVVNVRDSPNYFDDCF